MSLYGSLFAGVSGLQSQSNTLGIISDNISNVNTVGYKGASSLFQTLVTPNASATQYSPGGVIGGNRQLVTHQGLVQGTGSATDIAISGAGFFVVNTASDGEGTTLYTRAGSFTQDSLGNFLNSSGLYLQAWPLDRDGRLPGVAGNTTFTTSSADLGSLQVVNLKTTSGSASATSTVALSLNLNAGETVFPGASDIIRMDSNSVNSGIAAASLIVSDDYGAASVNGIRRSDTFTATSVDADGGILPHVFEYGGFSAGRSISGVTPVTLGNNAFTVANGSTAVTVHAVGHDLGPIGSTRYIDIEGAAKGVIFTNSSDINGIFQVTITDADHFTYTARNASIASGAGGYGGAASTIDASAGDNGAGATQTLAATNRRFLQLGNNAFSIPTGSNLVTVTMQQDALGPVGSTRWVQISPNVNLTGTAGLVQSDVSGLRLVTITGTGTTFTFNASANNTAGGGPIVFGGDAITVNDFAGNILDSTSASTAFLSVSGTNLFTSAALSFSIVANGVTHTFTYKSSSPSASNGEFNSMNNLATAISATSGLTGRVVNGRLYVSAADANLGITYTNGDAVGDASASVPLGGINWVDELGLTTVTPSTGSNRFNTLGGLANIVNTTDDLAAVITNATSAAHLAINVRDPRGTLQMVDEDGSSSPLTNAGSLLAEFGIRDEAGNLLVSSLNGVAYSTPGDTGVSDPKYDASGTLGNNMASGDITPQFSRNVTVFDSLGSQHEITVAYLKIGTNTWAVEAYVKPASEISTSLVDGQIAVGSIAFNGDGSLLSVDTGLSSPASANWTGGATASTITFDWGTVGGIGTGKTDGLSQFDANYSLNFITQNGAPVGQLSSVGIDGDGFITATFTNGEVQKLYKIPIADFNNPNGLQTVSGNAFSLSNNSGTFNLREAGQNGVGSISPSSLESSNVELSEQLTAMIVAQRSYEANTKIITTVDTLLQELNQILQ